MHKKFSFASVFQYYSTFYSTVFHLTIWPGFFGPATSPIIYGTQWFRQQQHHSSQLTAEQQSITSITSWQGCWCIGLANNTSLARHSQAQWFHSLPVACRLSPAKALPLLCICGREWILKNIFLCDRKHLPDLPARCDFLDIRQDRIAFDKRKKKKCLALLVALYGCSITDTQQ